MLKEEIKWLLQGDPSIFYLTNKYLMETDPLDLMMIQEQIPLNGWALDFFPIGIIRLVYGEMVCTRLSGYPLPIPSGS